MALLSVDSSKPGVSVDLNVSFIAAAQKGQTLTIEGRVLKLGRSLGFTEVTLSVDGMLNHLLLLLIIIISTVHLRVIARSLTWFADFSSCSF